MAPVLGVKKWAKVPGGVVVELPVLGLRIVNGRSHMYTNATNFVSPAHVGGSRDFDRRDDEFNNITREHGQYKNLKSGSGRYLSHDPSHRYNSGYLSETPPQSVRSDTYQKEQTGKVIGPGVKITFTQEQPTLL